MTSAQQAMRAISNRLPLKVLYVDWEDPTLILRGDGWRVSIMTAWRVVLEGRLIVGSDAVDEAALRAALNRTLITGCGVQSTVAGPDPTFVFATGHVLEVFSVGPLEPWVALIEGAGLFASSPSE